VAYFIFICSLRILETAIPLIFISTRGTNMHVPTNSRGKSSFARCCTFLRKRGNGENYLSLCISCCLNLKTEPSKFPRVIHNIYSDNCTIIKRKKTCTILCISIYWMFNPLNPELNPICYLLALLAHRILHVSRIRVKSLTLRLLMSYIWSTYSWCF